MDNSDLAAAALKPDGRGRCNCSRNGRIEMTLTLCPHKLRNDIPEPPQFMARLPIDKRGYPVPWFVDWIDGVPEFRAMDPRKFKLAITERRCWVCGNKLFPEQVFTVGPMCGINRISSEPPSHRQCAEYSAVACPFLSKPHMHRREDEEFNREKKKGAGLMIERNPGVTLLWYTRRHQLLHVSNGVLFKLGQAFKLAWYCQGRAATRDEIMESINSGLPALRAAADRDPQPGAHEALDREIERGLRLVPRR